MLQSFRFKICRTEKTSADLMGSPEGGITTQICVALGREGWIFIPPNTVLGYGFPWESGMTMGEAVLFSWCSPHRWGLSVGGFPSSSSSKSFISKCDLVSHHSICYTAISSHLKIFLVVQWLRSHFSFLLPLPLILLTHFLSSKYISQTFFSS